MWLRLWSVARYDLRLTDEEFYRSTPRQVRALLKRREVDLERSEYMTAQLTAVVKNYSFREIEIPAQPRDFMLSDKAQPEKRESKAAERKRSVFQWRAFAKAYAATHERQT